MESGQLSELLARDCPQDLLDSPTALADRGGAHTMQWLGQPGLHFFEVVGSFA